MLVALLVFPGGASDGLFDRHLREYFVRVK
jgi:hypothetical protein